MSTPFPLPIQQLGGMLTQRCRRLYKAGDFEGPGGPEDKAKMEAEANPGSNEVRDNIRQGYREG